IPEHRIFRLSWFTVPESSVGSLQSGDDSALLYRPCFHCTLGNQLVERLGHRLHRANLVFDLQLLLHRSRANVAATSVIAIAQNKLAYLGEREAAVLRMLDEADAPGRILVIQPVAGKTFSRKFDQPHLLAMAQRVVAHVCEGNQFADCEHAASPA